MSGPLPPAPPPSPTGSLHSSNMPAIAHSPFAANFDPHFSEGTPKAYPLPDLSLDDTTVLPAHDGITLSSDHTETLGQSSLQPPVTAEPSPEISVKPLIRFPTNHTHVTLPQHNAKERSEKKRGRRKRWTMCSAALYILLFLALLAWLITFLMLRQANVSRQVVVPVDRISSSPVYIYPKPVFPANLTTTAPAPSRRPLRKLAKTLGTHALVAATAYTLAKPRRSRRS